MKREGNTDVNLQEIEPKAEEYLNKSSSTQVTPNPSPIIINIFPYKSMSHLRLALHKLFYQQYQNYSRAQWSQKSKFKCWTKWNWRGSLYS